MKLFFSGTALLLACVSIATVAFAQEESAELKSSAGILLLAGLLFLCFLGILFGLWRQFGSGGPGPVRHRKADSKLRPFQ